MTERQYVEEIRKSAQHWIDSMGNPDAVAEALDKWEMRKSSLSPWTTIELCDAWLKNQDNLVQTDG